MKKFIIFMLAILATTVTYGQTIEKSKLFDNTYIGVNGGTFGFSHQECNGFENFGKSIRGDASLRLGKMVTPVLGFEIEGEVGIGYFTTFVDHTFVSWNTLFNFNHIFHPYRGEPDKVEFIPLFGIGWHHTYGTITNNIASKVGMQINFNLGEKKAWQFNIIPTMNYIMTDNGFDNFPTRQPRFDVCRSYVNLQIGFTYKFKNSKGTHNFVISPYLYTQNDIDDLMNQVNQQRELVNNQEKTLKQKDIQIKSLMDENAHLKNRKETVNKTTVTIPTTIGFEIGSDKIPTTQRPNMIILANKLKESDSNITIVGYADKNTGSHERNMELSEARANSVANELIKLGVNLDNINVVGKGATEQLFDENDANRVVIFVTE